MPDEPISIPTIYSNSVKFGHSFYDFSMVFGISEMPLKHEGKEKNIVSAYARIVMSPAHFKRFVEIDNEVLENFEKSHGKIPKEKEKSKRK